MSEATSLPSSEEIMRDFQAQDAADLANELGTETEGNNGQSRVDSDPATGGKLSRAEDVVKWAEANADQLPEGVVDVLKNQQRTISRQGREMAERLARLEGRLEGQQPETVEPTPEEQRRAAILQRIPAGQRESFRVLAEELGYVQKADVEAQQVEQKATSYSQQAQQQGIEQFGETFGTLEGNTFQWNDQVEMVVRETADRLTDDARGVTELDLFRLAQFDDLLAAAREEGRQETAQGRMNGIQMRQQAATVNSSSPPSLSAPSIYDKDKGDKLSDVVARAVHLASRGQ